ncbi:hypothetical protein ACFQYP_55750 [Nonomuraea antimicrobica]
MAKVTRGRRPILVPALVSGLAAMVVAVTLVTSQFVTAPSAQAAVVAAAERTATESFRSHVVTTQEIPDGRPYERVVDGFFDPATRYGHAQVREPAYEMIFIGDTVYRRLPADLPEQILAGIPEGKQWVATDKVEDRGPVHALAKQGFPDPAAALRQLEAADEVVETSQGRYTFELPVAEELGQALTGTVEVDDEGRVRRLEIVAGPTRTTLEFRDHGAREPERAAPPEAEVQRLGEAIRPAQGATEPAASPA